MDMKELVGNVLRLNIKRKGVAYRYLLSHQKNNVLKLKQDKSMIPHASTKRLEEGEYNKNALKTTSKRKLHVITK